MSVSSHPNVIVFLTDQQRWDCAGLHGNPLDLMPNFDRLAGMGTHLRYSFTCHPLCAPARSCLQTGCYPSRTGVFSNQQFLKPGTPTLASHFRAAGYQTAYIGKWHLAPHDQPGAVAPEYRGGYEDWFAANLLELVSDAYDCRLYDENNREHSLSGYRVDALTDAALAYLARPHEKPFLLFLSYLEPHQQNNRDDYPAPVGYAERYAGKWLPADLAALQGSSKRHLGGYCGMVKRLDDALGRLWTALHQMGHAENTILLFTSDHGCHFRTRNAEYKRSCHESSIRVPSFLIGPGFYGGGDRDELVSLIDLPPTLLEAAGVAVPTEMQGDSLMPRLRGEGAWRDEVFIQISEAQNARALRTRRWKYCVSAQNPGTDQVLYGPACREYMEESLYDLESDPAELENLIVHEAYTHVASTLRKRLLARMTEAGENPPEIYPPRRAVPS